MKCLYKMLLGAKIALVLLPLALPAANSQAATKDTSLDFSPNLQILRNSTEEISLMFLVPCQSKFAGLLVQELDHSFRIAIIVAKTSIPCGGLPTKEILTLSGYKFGKPLEVYVDNLGKGRLKTASSIRLNLAPATDGIDRDNPASSLPSLDFWHSTCATLVGVMIRPARSHNYDVVEALHYLGKSERGNCLRQAHNVSLAFMPDKQLNTLRTSRVVSKASPAASPTWRLRPVELAKHQESLRVFAELSCGDYLVGLVALSHQGPKQLVAALILQNPRSARSGQQIPVSCQKKRASLDLSGLLPKGSKVLTSIQQEIPIEGQQVVAPNLGYQTSKGFTYSQSLVPGCEKPGLQVYGVDLHNNLVIGILTQPKRASCFESLQHGLRQHELALVVEPGFGSTGLSPMHLQQSPR